MDTNVERKSILWFGDIGRRNSFSRISESILPHLSKLYNVTILAPSKEQIIDPIPDIDNLKIVYIGEPLGELKWDDFRFMVPGCPTEQMEMKYTLLQAGYLCDTLKIDYLFFVGGNFVIEWFMKLINQRRSCIPSKIVVWTPFDYIPSVESFESSTAADTFITMNPVMSDILSKLSKTKVEWVHHGTSDSFQSLSKKDAMKKLNKIRHTFYNCPKRLNDTDTIILNANNFIERKNIETSLAAFSKVFETNKTIKFWLHTNTKSVKFLELVEKFKTLVDQGYIIITHNDVTDKVLNLIYNSCDIGLQTSTGEGWSLTNCEHEKTGAIQVVPDFLATQFNFKDSGILIPVTETTEPDENGNDTVVGIVMLVWKKPCVH
jgi:glycosyltransferase involved in cell wall biosynthesis